MSNSILKAVFEQGESQKPSTRSADRTVHSSKQGLSLPRIFVVDDDPIFCKLIERVGTTSGFQIRAFQSLSHIGETDLTGFDVAVMDFDLGCVDGIEMASYLEKELGHLPIVFVSSTDRRNELDSRLGSRNSVFVSKQAGPNKILEICRQTHNR